MKIVEPVDPYRAYQYLPEAHAALRVDGESDDVGPNPNSLHEFYNAKDNKEVVGELRDLIFRSHQVDVLLGQRHFAPSPTWRDEFLMDHGYEFISRFAVRVHLFEKVREHAAGRYLGFVSLRPPGSKERYEHLRKSSAQQGGQVVTETVPPMDSPAQGGGQAAEGVLSERHYRWIIEAELSYPTHMLRPRYHIISTTASSARLGVLPFRSTVYMAPNMSTLASSCTHVALSQALHLVMGRFGSRPISQREFEMLVWVQASGAETAHDSVQPTYQNIRMEGVNLHQALAVVRNECHGGGFLAIFHPRGNESDTSVMRRAHRCLTDTLANGLPVIMHVDGEVLAKWTPQYERDPLPNDAQEREKEEAQRARLAHAILIFGMRLIAAPDEALTPATSPREDCVELPGRFVGHDPVLGPFSEWRTQRMLEAALAAYPPGDPKRGIYMLALGPATMKMGMDDVRDQAQIQMTKLARGSGPHRMWCQPYMERTGIRMDDLPRAADPEAVAETPGGAGSAAVRQQPWRFVIRLQSRAEIRRRYLSVTQPEFLGSSSLPICGASDDDMQKLLAALSFLCHQAPEAHFWCVEVIWGADPPKGIAEGEAMLCDPVLVMFFHAGEERTREPEYPFALLRWSHDRLEYQPTSSVPHALVPYEPHKAAQPARAEVRKASGGHNPLARFPEVSLITSWHLPPPRPAAAAPGGPTLHALSIALDQQLGLLDLYFMDDSDVPWYWMQLHGEPLAPGKKYPSALRFAADLKENEIKLLAKKLSEFVVLNYKGRLVGPRPRFAAIATYWPHLSVPREWQPDDKRPADSVKAVRNSLLLASCLGCRHVEIVGGSALPEIETDLDGNPLLPVSMQPVELQEALRDSGKARLARHRALVNNLCEIYTAPRHGDPEGISRKPHSYFRDLQADGRDAAPKLCLEVEPGQPFLINDIRSYVKVRNDLYERCEYTASHVLLNVDIAHMMLCQGELGRSGADCQMDMLETVQTRDLELAAAHGQKRLPGLKSLIGHMHISDHARTHASDLTPGSYHFFHDFLPWLKLAVELTSQPEGDFSGVIAVEMETCADIHEAARSLGRIRRWLEAAPNYDIQRPGRTEPLALVPPNTARINDPPSGAGIARPAGEAREAEAASDSRLLRAAIIVVDIGNSTSWALATGRAQEDADSAVATKIQDMIDDLCGEVHVHRGSVLSFTGDGVVAIFDQNHFSSAQACVCAALRAARDIASSLLGMISRSDPNDQRTARVSLHWGRVFMPTTSTLRYQAIGRDVILACRLCGWVKAELERGELSVKEAGASPSGLDYPSRQAGFHNVQGRAFIACTGAFHDILKTTQEVRNPAAPMADDLPPWRGLLHPRGNFAPKGFEDIVSMEPALQAYAIHSGLLGVEEKQK